jgi:hypothetical protein
LLNGCKLLTHRFTLIVLCEAVNLSETVFANPPITKAISFFSHFISTTCFSPDLGPLQVLFTSELF